MTALCYGTGLASSPDALLLFASTDLGTWLVCGEWLKNWMNEGILGGILELHLGLYKS